MADGNITVEVSTQAATAELRRLRVENAALKRDLEYARGGLTKGRTRMREDVTRLQAEVEQLRAENAALKREAHAWWTAARDAAVAERERCAQRVVLHSQYPIQTDYDRGYDKARKDAAETLRNMSTYVGTYTPDSQPKRTPLTEFERMRIIGDEFPIALVQQAVIAKVDAVCRAIERAHGIGA